jgi:hypothetical protein
LDFLEKSQPTLISSFTKKTSLTTCSKKFSLKVELFQTRPSISIKVEHFQTMTDICWIELFKDKCVNSIGNILSMEILLKELFA